MAINDLLTALIQLAEVAFWCGAHQNRRWPGQPAAVFLWPPQLAASFISALAIISTSIHKP
jgi:hypothetical protein